MSKSNKQRQWMVRQALLLVATCTLLSVLMLIVRAYAFTIYADPASGDHVVVNRLCRHAIGKGDRVVFSRQATSYMGVVEALPGDTIMLKGQQYLIPRQCVCNAAESQCCLLFLVQTATGPTLVSKDDMAGKAYKIY